MAILVCARDTASTSTRTTSRTLSLQLQIRRRRRASQSGSPPLRLAGRRFPSRRSRAPSLIQSARFSLIWTIHTWIPIASAFNVNCHGKLWPPWLTRAREACIYCVAMMWTLPSRLFDQTERRSFHWERRGRIRLFPRLSWRVVMATPGTTPWSLTCGSDGAGTSPCSRRTRSHVTSILLRHRRSSLTRRMEPPQPFRSFPIWTTTKVSRTITQSTTGLWISPGTCLLREIWRGSRKVCSMGGSLLE